MVAMRRSITRVTLRNLFETSAVVHSNWNVPNVSCFAVSLTNGRKKYNNIKISACLIWTICLTMAEMSIIDQTEQILYRAKALERQKLYESETRNYRIHAHLIAVLKQLDADNMPNLSAESKESIRHMINYLFAMDYLDVDNSIGKFRRFIWPQMWNLTPQQNLLFDRRCVCVGRIVVRGKEGHKTSNRTGIVQILWANAEISGQDQSRCVLSGKD